MTRPLVPNRKRPLLGSAPPATGRQQTVPVLIIKQWWMDKLLDGFKTMEIRGMPVKKHVGSRIWLSASGSSTISGSVLLVACSGPLSKSEWHEMRRFHCVSGDRPYGDKTYAYVVRDPHRVAAIPFERKRGAIIWQEVDIDMPRRRGILDGMPTLEHSWSSGV